MNRTPRIKRILAYPSAVALILAAAILTALPQQSSEAVIKGDRPTAAPPYVAYLQHVDLDGKLYWCSGSLIADNLVLSAKHCGTKDVAVIGSNDLNARGGWIRQIVKTEPFPGDNDVSIYVLKSSVPLEPISISTGDIELDPEVATLYGYGVSEPFPTGTQDFKLYSVDGTPTLCRTATVLEGNFCLNSVKAESSPCDGDSGAPLVIHDDDEGDLLVGVFTGVSIPPGSDRNQCADRPWIATRTSAEHIRAWMDKTINTYNP